MKRWIRVILILLLAGAVLLLVRALLTPDPQLLVRQATVRLLGEKTFRAETAASIEGKLLSATGTASAVGNVTRVTVRTDFDRTDPSSPSSLSSFRVAETSGGPERVLAGESRRKDKRHYLKIDEASLDEIPEASKLVGAWVWHDEPFLSLLLAQDPDGSAPDRPFGAPEWAALGRSLESFDLFQVVGKLPDERIDGVRARRLVVELDPEAMLGLLLKLRELRTGLPVDEDDVIRATSQAAAIGRPVGEVWIGKKDKRFRKIALGTGAGSADASSRIAATVLFSRYGAAVAVTAPEGAQALADRLGPLLSGRLRLSDDRSLTEEETPEASIPDKFELEEEVLTPDRDADGDGLSDGEEAFYGSDAWNPDTDGDGWTDASEVGSGMDPIGPGALFGFGL